MKNKGFTLVEIMIVVAIIGLLAAIAIPSFMKSRTTSQKNSCINNMRQIEAAKDQWAIEKNFKNGDYVRTDPANVAQADDEESFSNLVGQAEGYIKQFPLCPSSGNKAPSAANSAADYTVGAIGVSVVCNVLGAGNTAQGFTPTHVLP